MNSRTLLVRFAARVVLLIATVAAVTFPIRAATPWQLAEAMDIPTNAILTASFTHLANASAAETARDWGTLSPTNGTNFAVLSTGRAVDQNSVGYVSPQPGTQFANTGPNPAAGQTTTGPECQTPITEAANGNDYTALSVVLVAPTNAVGLSLTFRFYSSEYPESLCTQFNDRFAILLNSQAFNGNMAFDDRGQPISVNTVRYSVTNSSDLTGTGMSAGIGGGTEWLTSSAPVTPADTITLKFIIFDAGDRGNDSLALIDNFQWITSTNPPPPATGPTLHIGRAVQLKWASFSNQLYQVQWAPILDSNAWNNLGDPVTGNGATNTVFDSAEPGSRYYRIVRP